MERYAKEDIGKGILVMDIATLLFTYNRSWHTEQVLNSLKYNTVLPQKLFVFQDGLRQDEDACEWNKVNSLIYGIDWCETEIIVSEYNKGLADSIISGINYVFKEYDAIIVLEDDCVPAVDFLNFMYQCLEKYQNMTKIYSVSGYAWPIELPEADEDIYFCGRISSWGWGTWKNRWDMYERDYTILKQIYQNQDRTEELMIWGADLEKTLICNIKGQCNSWAVFWALIVIYNGGVCINPYQSFIHNIGHDGSGVHCGKSSKFIVPIDERKNVSFNLPDTIHVFDTTRKVYKVFSENLMGKSLEEIYTYYRNCLEKWVEFKQQGKSITSKLLENNIYKVVIYGIGTIGKLLIDEFAGKVDVSYILMTNKSVDEFMGYQVFGCNDEIPEISDKLTLIIIPGYDAEIIEQTVGSKFLNVYSLENLLY